MLAMHPHYQQLVYNEIVEIFPEKDFDVTADNISLLEYTDRFIKETLRLLPVVPLVGKCAKSEIQVGQLVWSVI